MPVHLYLLLTSYESQFIKTVSCVLQIWISCLQNEKTATLSVKSNVLIPKSLKTKNFFINQWGFWVFSSLRPDLDLYIYLIIHNLKYKHLLIESIFRNAPLGKGFLAVLLLCPKSSHCYLCLTSIHNSVPFQKFPFYKKYKSKFQI